MTDEMAIKWLKWIKNCLIPGSEQDKAIDIAISSIESKNSNDKATIEKYMKKIRELQLQLLKEPLLIKDAYNHGYVDGVREYKEGKGK